MTVADPAVGCAPVQSVAVGAAEAEQDVEFLLVHVRETVCPTIAVLGLADKLTVGFTGGGVEEPPPQALHTRQETRLPASERNALFFMATPRKLKSGVPKAGEVTARDQRSLRFRTGFSLLYFPGPDRP